MKKLLITTLFSSICIAQTPEPAKQEIKQLQTTINQNANELITLRKEALKDPAVEQFNTQIENLKKEMANNIKNLYKKFKVTSKTIMTLSGNKLQQLHKEIKDIQDQIGNKIKESENKREKKILELKPAIKKHQQTIQTLQTKQAQQHKALELKKPQGGK